MLSLFLWQAVTVQELGECLVEAQRYMNLKNLKGMMQPSKKLMPVAPSEGSEASTTGMLIASNRLLSFSLISSVSTITFYHIQFKCINFFSILSIQVKLFQPVFYWSCCITPYSLHMASLSPLDSHDSGMCTLPPVCLCSGAFSRSLDHHKFCLSQYLRHRKDNVHVILF